MSIFSAKSVVYGAWFYTSQNRHFVYCTILNQQALNCASSCIIGTSSSYILSNLVHWAPWMSMVQNNQFRVFLMWVMTRMSRMQSFQVSRSVGPRQTRKSSLQPSSLILSSGSHLFVGWTSSIGVEFAPYLPGCGSASILHLSPLLNSPQSKFEDDFDAPSL